MMTTPCMHVETMSSPSAERNDNTFLNSPMDRLHHEDTTKYIALERHCKELNQTTNVFTTIVNLQEQLRMHHS